jgi:hypothetical protein
LYYSVSQRVSNILRKRFPASLIWNYCLSTLLEAACLRLCPLCPIFCRNAQHSHWTVHILHTDLQAKISSACWAEYVTLLRMAFKLSWMHSGTKLHLSYAHCPN